MRWSKSCRRNKLSHIFFSISAIYRFAKGGAITFDSRKNLSNAQDSGRVALTTVDGRCCSVLGSELRGARTRRDANSRSVYRGDSANQVSQKSSTPSTFLPSRHLEKTWKRNTGRSTPTKKNTKAKRNHHHQLVVSTTHHTHE